MVNFNCCLLILICMASSPVVMGAPSIDRVYVIKSKRLLYLLDAQRIIRTYKVSLGRQPLGHKQYQGDSRTPEGKYIIDYRNPHSHFTLSLHINYPDRDDRQHAQARGKPPGGDIFLHGLPNGVKDDDPAFRGRDWTDGCIAVSNRAIREIWRLVRNGTPIEIVP